MERHCPRARLPIAFAILAAGGVGGLDPAHAGVYRCTDADGALYFSDVACPPGFAKEELKIESGSSAERGAGAAGGPYTLEEQVRAMDELAGPKAQSRRSKKSEVDATEKGTNPGDRFRLDSIEDELAKLDGKEKELREDAKFGTPIRKRWAREGLQDIRTERRQLLRRRQNILGTSR